LATLAPLLIYPYSILAPPLADSLPYLPHTAVIFSTPPPAQFHSFPRDPPINTPPLPRPVSCSSFSHLHFQVYLTHLGALPRLPRPPRRTSRIRSHQDQPTTLPPFCFGPFFSATATEFSISPGASLPCTPYGLPQFLASPRRACTQVTSPHRRLFPFFLFPKFCPVDASIFPIPRFLSTCSPATSPPPAPFRVRLIHSHLHV